MTSSKTFNRREALLLGAAGMATLASATTALAGEHSAPAEPSTEPPAPLPFVPYMHYMTGGPDAMVNGVVIFEYPNSGYTKYQVAITSCTCRDAAYNFRSVMYVEITNGEASADGAQLRWVSFGEDGDYIVGMWGDSSPIPTNPEYTKEYLDEHLMQPLVGLTKADFDAWEGYGDMPGDVDLVSGATVTCSNVVSALQAVMAYHAEKYYA